MDKCQLTLSPEQGNAKNQRAPSDRHDHQSKLIRTPCSIIILSHCV